jgi:hypothetical protein
MLKWIALHGRRDFPTDGVEDYRAYLSRALTKQGVELQLVQVPWAEKGWFYALRWLWQEARTWQGRWVLVQYTACHGRDEASYRSSTCA